MSRLSSPCLSVAEGYVELRFEKRLRGAFQSHLVSDSRDARWALKCASAENVYALINETLGWEFCYRLGLPVPPCKVVKVPDTYFEDPRTWFSKECGERRPKQELHFLSRFVSDVELSKCYEHLPSVWLGRVSNRSDCLGMFVFDVWADHRDKRQAIYAAKEEGLKATFIDNTHLFGGPGRSGPDRYHRLSAAEIVALSAAEEHGGLDDWIDLIRKTMPGALSRTLDLLPQEWREFQARDSHFQAKFTSRLERLDELVHSALDRARSFAPAFRSQFFCVLAEDEAPSVLPLV